MRLSSQDGIAGRSRLNGCLVYWFVLNRNKIAENKASLWPFIRKDIFVSDFSWNSMEGNFLSKDWKPSVSCLRHFSTNSVVSHVHIFLWKPTIFCVNTELLQHPNCIYLKKDQCLVEFSNFCQCFLQNLSKKWIHSSLVALAGNKAGFHWG